VIATHTEEVIRALCNKLLWLNRGEVAALGPVDEVIERYKRAQLAGTQHAPG